MLFRISITKRDIVTHILLKLELYVIMELIWQLYFELEKDKRSLKQAFGISVEWSI